MAPRYTTYSRLRGNAVTWIPIPFHRAEYKVFVCWPSLSTGSLVDMSGRNCLTQKGGIEILGSHDYVYAPGGQGVYYDVSLDSVVIYYHYREYPVDMEGARDTCLRWKFLIQPWRSSLVGTTWRSMMKEGHFLQIMAQWYLTRYRYCTYGTLSTSLTLSARSTLGTSSSTPIPMHQSVAGGHLGLSSICKTTVACSIIVAAVLFALISMNQCINPHSLEHPPS